MDPPCSGLIDIGWISWELREGHHLKAVAKACKRAQSYERTPIVPRSYFGRKDCAWTLGIHRAEKLVKHLFLALEKREIVEEVISILSTILRKTMQWFLKWNRFEVVIMVKHLFRILNLTNSNTLHHHWGKGSLRLAAFLLRLGLVVAFPGTRHRGMHIRTHLRHCLRHWVG